MSTVTAIASLLAALHGAPGPAVDSSAQSIVQPTVVAYEDDDELFPSPFGDGSMEVWPG